MSADAFLTHACLHVNEVLASDHRFDISMIAPTRALATMSRGQVASYRLTCLRCAWNGALCFGIGQFAAQVVALFRDPCSSAGIAILLTFF